MFKSVSRKERKREPDISKLFIYAFFHLCVTLPTHTPTLPSQGQCSSPAAEQPPSLTAALLSHGHPSYMAANRGVAWAVSPLTQAIQRLQHLKRMPCSFVAKIRENW